MWLLPAASRRSSTREGCDSPIRDITRAWTPNHISSFSGPRLCEAAANRADFDRYSVTVVNLMSAPGAGQDDAARAFACATRSCARRRARRRSRLHSGLGADRAARSSRRPDRHRIGISGRAVPRRRHGSIGDTDTAATRSRPARDRERRRPRLARSRRSRRASPRHGLVGHGRAGRAAQVPADVPGLRAGRHQQDRSAAACRLRSGHVSAQPRRRPSRRRAATSVGPYR